MKAVLDSYGRRLRRSIGFTQSMIVDQEPRTERIAENLCGFQIHVEDSYPMEECNGKTDDSEA